MRYLCTAGGGEPSNPMVAFTAYALNATYTSAGETMQFEQVVTNIGAAFDNATGLFTCPVDGVYLFYASIHSQNGSHGVGDIYKGDEYLVTVYTSDASEGQSDNLVITECSSSTAVSVRTKMDDDNKVVGGDVRRGTTFSGYLLGQTELTSADGKLY